MTEIMPFPENNDETVLLDRPVTGSLFRTYQKPDRFGRRCVSPKNTCLFQEYVVY